MTVDKKGETIAAVRKYESMQMIISAASAEEREQFNRMTAPRQSNMTAKVVVHGDPMATQDQLAEQLDVLFAIQSRYRKACDFIRWFEPMWNALNDNERELLETYLYENYCGATSSLASKMGYTVRNVRYLRTKALERLQLLLYGE